MFMSRDEIREALKAEIDQEKLHKGWIIIAAIVVIVVVVIAVFFMLPETTEQSRTEGLQEPPGTLGKTETPPVVYDETTSEKFVEDFES